MKKRRTKPKAEGTATCLACGFKWESKPPKTPTSPLECPKCTAQASVWLKMEEGKLYHKGE